MSCLAELAGPYFTRELEHLVQSMKNEEIKNILQGTKPSDWICDNGMTLLHLAVTHKNLTLIQYLLDIGYDVNAKNSSGNTALLIALDTNQFLTVKILLDANADDFLTDKSAIGKLMTKSKEMIQYIIPHCLDNFKRRNLDTETLAESLIAADFPFEYILPMKDIQLNREYLIRHPSGNYENGMNRARETEDHKTVELIMRYGNESGKLALYKTMMFVATMIGVEFCIKTVEQLSDWCVVSEEAFRCLSHMFAIADLNSLKKLFDLKIHEKVREQYEIDFRVSIFINKNVDAIEFLKNQDFNVNARGYNQHTALHYAVKRDLLTPVKYLLDSGAQVNAINNQGRTAIFDCIERNNAEICQQLLEYGANVQIIDDNGVTVFEFAQSKKSDLLDLLFAQLAINYIRGIPIKHEIQSIIDANEKYKIFYDTCCQQLQVLNTVEVIKSVTLFNVLVNDNQSMCHFACYQKIVSLLDQFKCQHELYSFYSSTMMSKLRKAFALYYFKSYIAGIISKVSGTLVDFDHLIIAKISEYFTQKDIDGFAKDNK